MFKTKTTIASINIATLVKVLNFLKCHRDDMVTIKVSKQGIHLINEKTSNNYLIVI